MSKGIVMEKHRNYIIVMTQDGSFRKVKSVKDADIGAEISYEMLASKKGELLFFHSKKSSRYVAIACMVLLFVMPFFLLGGQNKTYAYVNLDINPSLEIEIDQNLNVVSISPLNDDARKLIQKLPDYQDKKIERLIELIMNKSDALGLTKHGKNVLVGVSYVDGRDISVLDTVDNYFLTHNTSWDIATFQVPGEIREQAQKEKVSMNKVMAENMETTASEPEKMVLKTRADDDEKELIHSFYSNSKSTHQNSDLNQPVSEEGKDNHPAVVPKLEKKKAVQRQSEPKKHTGDHSNRGHPDKSAKQKSKKASKEKPDKKEKQQEKKHKVRQNHGNNKHHNNGHLNNHRSNNKKNANNGNQNQGIHHGNNGNKQKNGHHGNHGNNHGKGHEKHGNKK
ncbi:hypothetical protein CFK37_01130 [Virgibacillus phasianinus]|uniref:RsgI N-terminal anti-sigma domain-containing protein n=1 Tax=Virgibacillus phasianinus TaxID=2017483 RepID=A0A220TYT7_9BACI|nr:anti-sigma factor domain-containing protein [Virgibacillus phasianinus]ASK60910.1 hypothetical protein CFK37_01130 [Virgibacillus phasianinus]